jgi:hypothetical protein
MNIIEAEDMVKGLPDQVLFQYAQNPPPNIPQFLAVSEVQRRQEMRQRFQAQQAGQQQPTVKDQILQGGIASAGGPPPGGGQPPMAPPMGGGQPPVMAAAGGMMPYRMANGGMTPGGIVRMQQGRTVPSINLTEQGIASLLQQYMTPSEISPEEKAYRDLIARQAQQGIPAGIDYSPLIKQSEAAQKEARDAARSQGISAALMQLGAGLTAGDIAGGQQRAAEAVSQVMARGRQEEAAERQYGRQLQMQGAEAQRQAQIAQMNFLRENAKALADIQSGSRKEAESKLGTALNVVTSFTNSSLDRANQAKIQGDRVFADAERQKQISRDAFLDTVREGIRSFSPKPLEGRDALKPDLVNKYNQDLKRAITLAYRSVPYTDFYMTREEVDKVLKEALAQIDEAATPVPSEPNQGSGGRPPIGEFDRPQG